MVDWHVPGGVVFHFLGGIGGGCVFVFTGFGFVNSAFNGLFVVEEEGEGFGCYT
jgi:hypothetical protein